MEIIPCKPNFNGILACFNVYYHNKHYVRLFFDQCLLIFFSETNITAVFQEAVSLFNEAGCVKWVPRTSEVDFISVIGNELK